MAAAKSKPVPKYVIDTYGLREALTTTQNSVRIAVVTAITNGEMLILKTVSKELKENDPDVYVDMQTIASKKYLPIDAKVGKAAAVLVDQHGGSRLWGATPPIDRFRALAAAGVNKLILITDGKALRECQAIANKCRLPRACVKAVSAV